ncbi:toprim domain-containing protein [Emticicia sp. C21]|uniref:toprim domain-containing protein n=1 Tax=Emticicia sp. C21 TaxID=2302915 RepID=UPI000E8BF662|nr:toprim domain-containing protein [Emticicia sp. C21]RFS16090.1 hypothetical protein D0T08_14470 [Emticicia sp. C21]
MSNAKPYYTKAQIQQIKDSCKITDYLASHGYEPVKFKNGEWYYSSIGIQERTPSFRVNALKNVYQDYSSNQDVTGKCGDILRLVQALEFCDFTDACHRLATSEFTSFKNLITSTNQPVEKQEIEIVNVGMLKRRVLIDYIEFRQIGLRLANTYLKEIDYINGHTHYFSIGFANDLEGYALRSPPTRFNKDGFKGQTKPNYYTTLQPHHQTNICNVFEGFFSCLSCLQYYNRFYFDNLTYVLNSLSNFNKLLPNVPEHITQINLFLDNDEAGNKWTEKLQGLEKWQIADRSLLYSEHKDFNEFLIQKNLLY